MKSHITIDSESSLLHKRCRNREEFNNELFIYKLNLEITPKLISDNEETLTLTLSFVEGVDLWSFKRVDFREIGTILQKLHEATEQDGKVITHYDTNPHNYIYSEIEKRYYIIDFSESRLYYPEWDLVSFLLFWAACCEPNDFNDIFKQFSEGYQAVDLLNKERIELFPELFSAFDQRRIKYGKRVCQNREWNEINRSLIMRSFYR